MPRIPNAIQGFQINHCKDPFCPNFGLPASPKSGRGRKPEDRDQYKITGGKSSSSVSLNCLLCKQSSTLKSNFAIVEEWNRQLSISGQVEILRCPNVNCVGQVIEGQDFSKVFSPNGTTPSGNPRLRCKICRTTFTPGIRQRTQRRPELDEFIYRLLVNKMPMRRICETASIPPATLYSKINFIYNQTRMFARKYGASTFGR